MLPVEPLQLNFESQWLSEFVSHYGAETEWTLAVERQLLDEGMNLSHLNQALKAGRVINTKREERNETVWSIIGSTCDAGDLFMTACVTCDAYKLCVTSIEKC